MGLVFFRTAALDEIVTFYIETVGARVWHEQPDCTILERGASRLGLCAGDEAETAGTITFVQQNRARIDAVHDRLADRADRPSRYNDRYGIYQFFATDPEGRTIEVQTSEHD